MAVTLTNHDVTARYTSGRVGPPAVRVGVHVRVGAHQRPLLAQGPDHRLVGVEHLQALEVGDLRR